MKIKRYYNRKKMVWIVEFVVYEKSRVIQVFEIPPDFYEWVDGQGRFHHPEKGVPYFLGSKMPAGVDPMDIECAKIFEDIRYKMAEVFFEKCLEEHKGEVIADQQEEREKEREKEIRYQRIKEMIQKKKEEWEQKCSSTRGLQCEECHQNLYRDQDDYNRRGGDRRLIRLCWDCGKKNVIRDGKKVRCCNVECEKPVRRNQYTTALYDMCTFCHQKDVKRSSRP